ncbi:MAG TPA: tetratricopeptide repeat protein [Armatimonadota bacterium]|nr:tetratricopeptide repeat protein [Armatimonadota bacterium]
MGWSVRAWRRADHHYTKGSRLLRSGKPGEAVKAYAEVLAVFPKHARAHIQRAKALAAAGRTGDAVRAAKQAADLAPKNHAPLLVLGQIQYDTAHYEEARKAFAAAARIDPENNMAKAYLGLALLAMGRTEEGAPLLEEHMLYGYEGLEARLLTLAEGYLWEHGDEARSLEDQLTPDEGAREEGPAGFGLHVASALRIVLLWPLARLRGQTAVWRLKAEEAFSVREWDKAIAALQEMERAGADPEDTAASLGMAYLEVRKPEAAAEQFMRLPENVRREPDIALLAGAALFDAGRHEEARELLAIATQHFTKDFLPAYFRGLCDIALGQPGASTPWFAKAVERLSPNLAQKRFEEMMRVRSGARTDHAG